MREFFYVFLLTFLLSSGRYQFDALSLDPQTLQKVNFEIEDSELKEFESLPEPVKSYSEAVETPNEKKTVAEDKVKRHFAYEKQKGPFNGFPSQGNSGGIEAFDGLGECINLDSLHPKEIEYQLEPLDVNTIRAKMKKWSLCVGKKLKSDSNSYLLPASGSKRPARYLDYTNSQMPFNEGKIRRNGLQPKNAEKSPNNRSVHSPQVGDRAFMNEMNKFEVKEFLEAKERPKRSGRSLRRRRFEVPLRSRNFEITRDDPALEYSRVRRFLDHKRAKKQIRMTSTLEAKEAAMSRVLDPNLNLDGILEPHVRKRRGLYTGKRDSRFKPMYKKQLKKRKPAVYS